MQHGEQWASTQRTGSMKLSVLNKHHQVGCWAQGSRGIRMHMQHIHELSFLSFIIPTDDSIDICLICRAYMLAASGFGSPA